MHACLQISSIYFYEKTVKKLSDEEKNQYHKENMVSAGLVLLNIKKMPQTHEELKNWVITKSKEKNYLILTDVAEDVYEIIKKVFDDSKQCLPLLNLRPSKETRNSVKYIC